MPRLWNWLREEKNTKALQAILTGVPVLLTGATYIYTKLWPEPDYVFSRDATEFLFVTNVNAGTFAYGKAPNVPCPHKLLYNQPPYKDTPLNAAEFRFSATRGGKYRLLVEYAADEERPVNIEINKVLVKEGALRAITQDWCLTRWEDVGEFELKRGNNFVRIYRDNVFPHIRTVRLVRNE